MYCDCKGWFEEESNEHSPVNFDIIRQYGKYCPFCGAPLIDEKE